MTIETLRPDAQDVGSWTPFGAATNWQALDEVVPSATDYSGGGVAGDTAEYSHGLRLSNPSAPITAGVTAGTMYWNLLWLNAAMTGGDTLTFRMKLRQGQAGAFIATTTYELTTELAASPASGSYRLTNAEMAAITDFDDLWVFISSQHDPFNGASRGMFLGQLYVEFTPIVAEDENIQLRLQKMTFTELPYQLHTRML